MYIVHMYIYVYICIIHVYMCMSVYMYVHIRKGTIKFANFPPCMRMVESS